jgi:transglutaminase-like putative cysteine protease
MKLRVTHTTSYDYTDPVSLCQNTLHLQPRLNDRQFLHSCEIVVTPEPAVRSERIDFFGNPELYLAMQEPHRSLKIVAQCEVDVQPSTISPDHSSPAWDTVPSLLRQSRDGFSLEALQYTYESPLVPIHPLLADFARPCFAPGRPLMQAVFELTEKIHDEFTFDTRATNVGTPILDVLLHRHGVCQDFAQLQIGCLRSLGLPARYVSGYLLTQPPPGKARLIGADASHAWVSVYFPGTGWVDFDPTNAIIPGEKHVTVAWARDYDDISPVKGVILGGRHHALSVSVDVSPVEPQISAN